MQPDFTSTLTNMNLCKASLFDKDVKGNRGSDSNNYHYTLLCFYMFLDSWRRALVGVKKSAL